MLNKEKHQLIMGRILRDIYEDVSIASLLGLKGGTCAYFFYGLPRFSVDIDFDLLGADEARQKTVFESIKTILEKHGEVKDSRIKRFTVFFVLSYGAEDHNIKVEINTRMNIPTIQKHYELKDYLGISMFVAKKPYLFASKLAALTLRSKTAMRDIYDIWFFANKNWDIDETVIKIRTGKGLKEHLVDCIAVIEQVKETFPELF
jgi:predicted nucleotidyltransferase component of viral defense system